MLRYKNFNNFQHFSSANGSSMIERVSSIEAAFCGSLAGGISAALTTPLDVIKTRVMLDRNVDFRTVDLLAKLIKEEGFGRLFSGLVPRVAWITLGGGIFFGAFDFWKESLGSGSHSE